MTGSERTLQARSVNSPAVHTWTVTKLPDGTYRGRIQVDVKLATDHEFTARCYMRAFSHHIMDSGGIDVV